MELIAYSDIDSNTEETIATLDGFKVVREESGMFYLVKPHGSVYRMNDSESADPVAFLEKVKEYNL